MLQRVLGAAVRVDGQVVGAITRPGLLALVGVTHGDGPAQADWAGDRVAGLRVLRGAEGAGEVAVSAVDAAAPVLVVSQFTLYADTRRGRRPSWSAAAPAQHAEPLVDRVVQRLRGHGLEVATGAFGAHMVVESAGDGPVTIWLDSDEAGRSP